jgi:hypothetical protein
VVFIPKYGLKGNLYFRDPKGMCIFPPKCLNINGKDILISGYELRPEYNDIILQTSKGPHRIALFDKISVRIGVIESRAHRYGAKRS